MQVAIDLPYIALRLSSNFMIGIVFNHWHACHLPILYLLVNVCKLLSCKVHRKVKLKFRCILYYTLGWVLNVRFF